MDACCVTQICISVTVGSCGLAELAGAGGVTVFTQQEVTSEELRVDAKVCCSQKLSLAHRRLDPQSCGVKLLWHVTDVTVCCIATRHILARNICVKCTVQ